MAVGCLRALVAAVVAISLLAGPAQADPKPSLKKLKSELTALQKESDRLIEDYYQARIQLEKVEQADKDAQGQLDEAQAVLDHESGQLKRMAVEHYMNGNGETAALTMISGGVDPQTHLRRLTINQHILEEEADRLAGFKAVRDRHQAAQTEASERGKALKDSMKDLDKRKKRAEKLIEQIRDKIDLAHDAPGFRRSDGTWVPQLPTGSDHITPRMRLVRDLIVDRFGTGGYGVGCYRAFNDGGEHPLGRACDFMLSTGGQMPSKEQVDRGHRIAAWVVKNAKRLGIMYVIYRQRIWHVRTGQWRVMSNRGGNTANHYDHPHVSVY
ncbi:coiled-coil domain-containing protein [Nonomuraea soli]|uniref:Outer membrane murein-binding lipoprotein Lpp n=1 Tax=Nonomuraea soli TaxID=1032476 RepID=A0A7W0HUN1_9ACTN|nr:hypothetical protein [Nonomuraea soli]MBA2896152.1 outer membrane murein-binding lipoprotein Lpp [Nonomuraea soli]